MRNPYKGLRPFDEADASDFFGRARLADNGRGIVLSIAGVNHDGATERYNKPGFRLRAAVIETPGGPYFVKMTGQAKTMTAADADFKKFMATAAYK